MKKVLIIGTGNIAIRHFQNILKLKITNQIKILSRFSSARNISKNVKNCIITDMQKARKFNPNFILICSPSSLHIADIIKFITIFPLAKIFCEKPLTNKYKKINKIEKKSADKVYVGYQLRFNKLVLKLKSIIKKKIYGKVLSYKFITGQDIKDWRPNKKLINTVSINSKLGGGVMLELSHEIDLSLFLFGKPKNIFCKNKKSKYKNFDVEDNSNIFFEYENYISTICIDMFNPIKKRDLYVTFDKAYVHINFINNQIIIYKKNIIINKKIISNDYEDMIKNFFKKNRSINFSNFKTAALVNKVVEISKKSSKLSKKITLH